MGEVGYGGDAADVMDDYQQSADDSDFDPDVANEDYIVAEPDFDVICSSWFLFAIYNMSRMLHCHEFTVKVRTFVIYHESVKSAGVSDWRRVFISRCVFQIIDEIERSEGEESFDGELSEAVSQDRDHDVGDDLIIVGQLSAHIYLQRLCQLFI